MLILYNLVSVIMFCVRFLFSDPISIILYGPIFVPLLFIAYLISLLFLFLWSLYLGLLKKIICVKINNRFPINHEELERCGVHDRLDYLLYYHYIMHGFGLFRNPFINTDDYPIADHLSDLKLTFYSFYLSNESNEIIKQAVNDDIISSNIASIIYNSGTMTYDLLYGYHDRFNDLLEKSDKLYSVQMKKPFYRNH